MPQIPTYARRPRRPRRKGKPTRTAKKPSLGDFVNFTGKKKPPAKGKAPSKPTRESDSGGRSPKEEYQSGLASGLASMSKAIPGGKYSNIVKAGLAGAAAGSEIDASITRYKDQKAKAKAKKAKAAKTTVTQSAMVQKANFHKKDHTSTEKY